MNAYQEPKYVIENGRLVNRQSGETIPDDEPVFILRARDKNAAAILRAYASSCIDPAHREAANLRAAQFANWATLHSDRMREPDTQKDSGWTSAGNPPPPAEIA